METRTPLVYSTRAALRSAERLLPAGRCLENVVGAEILAGNVVAGQTGGLVFDRDKNWVAEVRRVPARLRTKRRAWLITKVRPDRRR